MTDREKVIGLLQEVAEYFRECRSNASFASKAENHFWELQNAANEAVKLLKEQEAVEPIRMHHTEHKQTDNYRCQKCGNDLYFEQRFCEACGQEVKWNEYNDL